MSSLSEKLSLLTNPTPAYLDPEDDVNIETAAKIKKPSDDNNKGVLFSRSELRSRAAVLLDGSDPAYVGKKVSRKSLDEMFHDGSDEELCSNDDDDDEEEEEEEMEDDDDLEHFKASLAEKTLSEEEKSNIDEESMEPEASDDEDIAESTANMVNQFSHIDVTNEIERGSAVKDQLEIINRLSEARIRLHKLQVIVHTFPQKDTWNAAKKSGGEEMVESMKKASTSTKSILNSCLDFQLDYFNGINDSQKNEALNDEEIPSDTDEEIEESKEKGVKKTKKNGRIAKRKLKSHEYADLLANHLTDLLPYRNSILQQWDEKTKLSSGKLTQKSFSGFENSVIKQIEQILQDKDRLVKRTRMKRSVYRIIGKPDISESEKDKDTENAEPVSKRDMLLNDYDPEIFDDDDFYHQFLGDIVKSKSMGIDDMSLRKQMEIQNARRKLRKNVDTKASKGRKIRYDVDPKLAGFAIAEPSEADDARESILKSLCGRYSCSS